MGGFGSGRYGYWGGGKPLADDMMRVDVRDLKRWNRLIPGQQFSWRWTRGGEPSGNLRITMDHDDQRPQAMRLIYTVTAKGCEPRSIDERVGLDWDACRFGGQRVWMRCPGCTRRVAVLYGGALFRCRYCHRVAYNSQNEAAMDRASRRGGRAMARLGSKEGFCGGYVSKPKWMRWATYERLSGQIAAAHRTWSNEARQRFDLDMANFLDGPFIDPGKGGRKVANKV
jgi:hypothetical protein